MPKLLGSRLIPNTRRIGAYLIYDTFTTNRAAGAINGTVAEPGPGIRTVVDTGSRLTITGGRLVAASGGASGDPRLRYGELGRRLGNIFSGTLSATGAGAAARVVLGAATASGSGFTYQLGLGGSGAIRIAVPGLALLTVGSYNVDTDYQFAIVLRASGIFTFYKPGSNWIFLYATPLDSSASLFFGFTALSSGAWSSDLPIAHTQAWLPTPLASDGFSSWGTTDGLGHAEGIAGGLGAGGSGKAWTLRFGTFQTSGGVANATSLSSSVAISTLDCGAADTFLSANIVWLAGTTGFVLRWVDNDNCIRYRHTGTNVQLVKVVAGVATTVLDIAATYVSGARLIIVSEGTKFRCFYNELALSTEQTIADAVLQSSTIVGLRTSDLTNTFDNFIVCARGTGGEYSVLG